MADSILSEKSILRELLDGALHATGTTSGVFVAIGPVCSLLGINARGQRKRIKEHPRLRRRIKTLQLYSYGGVQSTFCLPIDCIPEWILGIDCRRLRAVGAKARVTAAQRDCRVILRRNLDDAGTSAG